MILTFKAFPKITRYSNFSQRMIVTEKIDGTNAAINIEQDPDGSRIMQAQSRNRMIFPEFDNYDFAAWAERNKESLLNLGPGVHYGEWWGAGIGKRYGKFTEARKFSLFNTSRWGDGEKAVPRPACCSVVPVLFSGKFSDENIEAIMGNLKKNGSTACPGAEAEGIVIWVPSADLLLKKTFEGDVSKYLLPAAT